MNLLGIESSCDETAAAVVADGRRVLSSIVASQIALHVKYGGVVPEIASRAHIERINAVVAEALSAAGVGRGDLDGVVVAHRPGLVGSLLVGVTAAKTLAWAWGLPLVGVDHIHSHAFSPMLDLDRGPADLLPAVALVVSGGHTSLYHLQKSGPGPLSGEKVDLVHFSPPRTLGRCIDDAAGEAYDKVAAILHLGYPGGPIIDRLARGGDPKRFALPRSWLARDSLDFSFAGIKTAVLYQVRGQNMKGESRADTMSEQDKADLAASFQAAVVEVLVGKTLMAAARAGVRRIFVGGGVACNSALRRELSAAAAREGIEILLAQPKYCTDNAAMHAGLGYYRLQAGQTAGLDLSAVAS
ncbi:MAG: tRNA N6-adenosine threonylcarbamoyltransferase [Phycisphaerae bacterium]|nr:tRNA N6-adenosine threonylcarbamoyltransferase [Phycisphaerae bacterium]